MITSSNCKVQSKVPCNGPRCAGPPSEGHHFGTTGSNCRMTRFEHVIYCNVQNAFKFMYTNSESQNVQSSWDRWACNVAPVQHVYINYVHNVKQVIENEISKKKSACSGENRTHDSKCAGQALLFLQATELLDHLGRLMSSN